MTSPAYGTLPVINKIVIVNQNVMFWLNDSLEPTSARHHAAESPTGIWLRHIEEQLTLDILQLHHGYGCPDDGTLMTGPCAVCEQFAKDNPF